MRHSSVKILLIAILGFLVTTTSCDQKPKTPEHLKEKVDMSSKEYASAYICPMHCEGSGSPVPGNCPVCKMDYVKNSNFSGDMDDASEKDADTLEAVQEVDPDGSQSVVTGYTCPMHPEVMGSQGEVCGTCGMELVAMSDEDSDHTD